MNFLIRKEMKNTLTVCSAETLGKEQFLSYLILNKKGTILPLQCFSLYTVKLFSFLSLYREGIF